MLVIDHFSFTLAYPAYLNLPYTVQEVTDKIDEALMVFPGIEGCLPENVQLLAVKYAVEWLYSQECEDGSFGVMEEVKSRNDSVRYSLKGKGNDLVNSLWGGRLVRLMKTQGCYHHFGKISNCPPKSCGCG